jgi:CubicO group peptidase (beta-lactamase class C family)
MIDAAITANVRHILARETANGYCTGAVALVGQGEDREITALGARDVGGPPMTPDTLFRIASMTKPVTAAAALMLVEDGKLDLDAPIERWLPEMANRRVLRRRDAELDDTVPAKRPITVEDLLTFRMGLGVVMAPPGATPIQRAIEARGLMGFGPPDPTSPLTPDQWIAALGELPLMAQPGEAWLYTTGSNVLGVLISRVSGQSLPAVFAERLLGPLGMADTGFHVPPAKARRLGGAYRRTPDGLQRYDNGPTGGYSRPPALPAGDAGLVSTAADFFAFDRFLARKGVTADGRRLLSEASIAAMTRNHIPAALREGDPILGPGRGWGYGLSVVVGETPEGAPTGAYGWFGGLGASWTHDPASGRTAMVLTQTAFDSPDPLAIHTDVALAVFAGA